MTGIICAMQLEADDIAAQIENKTTDTISGVSFTRGTIYGKNIVIAVCGIGKVFAAACAEAMILTYHPDTIINVGVAGSLVPGLHVFDVAIAKDLCQHDMDTSAIGDPVGLVSGVNMIKFPASEKVNAALEFCLGASGIHFMIGTIASGDIFVADRQRKQYIRDTFDAIACEMEGASIAQVCYINNVEFAILRAISDEEGGDYQKFATRAAANSAMIIKEYFKLDK